MSINIAIIGATTLLGHEVLEVLGEEVIVKADSITALTDKRHAGREISAGDRDLKTVNWDEFDFSDIDVAIYTGTSAQASSIISKIANENVKVIDATGAVTFEMDHANVHSLPNPMATQIINCLRPLHALFPIKRICVSTYESVSVEGKDGMDELFNQSRKFFVHDAMENNMFSKQIAYNVIPQTDEFMTDGQTQSEWRLGADIKKFLDKNIKISSTCAFVPVFMGSSASVNVEFHGDFDIKKVKSEWRECDDIIIIDRGSELEFVTPVDIAGEDALFISRVREDSSLDNGMSFWCVADNIRAVSAIPAVKMVKEWLAA